jgi:hypothetical protein
MERLTTLIVLSAAVMPPACSAITTQLSREVWTGYPCHYTSLDVRAQEGYDTYMTCMACFVRATAMSAIKVGISDSKPFVVHVHSQWQCSSRHGPMRGR